MKKYLAVFSLSLQDALSERSSALIWAFLDLLWPLATLFVWLAIYGGGEGREIAGFSRSEMLTYYLGVALINLVASSHHEWKVFDLIQSGELSTYLLRPFNLLFHELASSLAWKILKGGLMLPVLVSLLFLFRPFLLFDFTFFQLFWLFLILSFSHFLFFISAFLLGSLTFFLEDPSHVFSLNELVRSLFSGALLPLALFPPFFQKVAFWLPYRYFYDFPLRVLTGKLADGEIFGGALVQLFWVALLGLLLVIVWRRGVKVYCAFGG